MVDIIMEYQGTIDEFIGDAIFVIFGAPYGWMTTRNGQSLAPWPCNWP
jgi:class 3 adenylate cyclase